MKNQHLSKCINWLFFNNPTHREAQKRALALFLGKGNNMKKIFISITLVVLTLISGACSGKEDSGWTAEEKSTLTFLLTLHDPWLKGEAFKSTVKQTTKQYSFREWVAEFQRINSE
jgi:excinuclease UvrABC ATPase subunit